MRGGGETPPKGMQANNLGAETTHQRVSDDFYFCYF